jgi:hypothetical protein
LKRKDDKTKELKGPRMDTAESMEGDKGKKGTDEMRKGVRDEDNGD